MTYFPEMGERKKKEKKVYFLDLLYLLTSAVISGAIRPASSAYFQYKELNLGMYH